MDMEKKNIKWGILWASVSTKEEALKVCKAAATFGFVSAAMTVALSLLAGGLNGAASLLDGGIILVTSLFLFFKQSRSAAIILFLVFLLGKVDHVVMAISGSLKANAFSWIFAILFLCAFLSGVRGSFAFQKFKKNSPDTFKGILPPID